MNVRKKFSLKNRLYLLLLICVIPLTVMITYLLFMINNVSSKYDHIVEKITKANAYNIGFKEDIDYVMYIIVVNSERAEELVDTQKPQKMIKEAREVFGELAEDADSAYAKQRLSRILKSLDTLEKRVQEIEEDALVSGSYETNMESLDLNIRVLTELIQEQIQYYIYYESMNMEDLRGGIRNDGDCDHERYFTGDLSGCICSQQKNRDGHHRTNRGAVRCRSGCRGWRFQNPGGENRTGRD